MASSLQSIVVLLVIACYAVHGYDIRPPSPVMELEPGLRYNPAEPQPSVRLDMFVDLYCPYSRDEWITIKALQNYYGPSKLDIVVQQLPLPYHRNAFLATQGLLLVRDYAPTHIFDYMEANWANLSNFSTANTVDKTETEVLNMLSDLAFGATGIDKAFFEANINSYRPETIATWKYSVRRVTFGTPQFFVNGVGIGSGIPTFDEWVAFLDPIINA